MHSHTTIASSDAVSRNGRAAGTRAARVGLICDFLEEGWPSMDLIGDMLYAKFSGGQADATLEVEQLRPAMRRRFSGIPVLGASGVFNNADRLLNRFHDYPDWLKRRVSAFDLFHIVDHSYSQLIASLPAQRTVVTCHDLDTFRCLLEPERDRRPRWFRAMAAKILDGFRRAAHVIAVSEATRDELLHHRLIPGERITVVSNGVHPSCRPGPDPAADRAADKLLDAPGGTPWLLNVGNTLPRKRLDVLVRVFAAVHRAKPETRLVRVGGLTAEQLQLARQLNVQDAILCLPRQDRDVLAAIYRRAALLVHTAEAEGFGLPLVEAMACGCPVAASDVAVLREVGGPATEYFPVADVQAWAQGVLGLLQERSLNAVKWPARRDRAIAWSTRFSWAENARQTARIYRQVLDLQSGLETPERRAGS